jgi:two-component system sensor histidine kinase YesM
MDLEKVENVMSGINTGYRLGYGLFNVIQRIKLYYGDDCGVHIESSKGVGTSAHLKIRAVQPK